MVGYLNFLIFFVMHLHYVLIFHANISLIIPSPSLFRYSPWVLSCNIVITGNVPFRVRVARFFLLQYRFSISKKWKRKNVSSAMVWTGKKKPNILLFLSNPGRYKNRKRFERRSEGKLVVGWGTLLVQGRLPSTIPKFVVFKFFRYFLVPKWNQLFVC